jgi:hypothetical protein
MLIQKSKLQPGTLVIFIYNGHNMGGQEFDSEQSPKSQ